jgi:hypothetical protein
MTTYPLSEPATIYVVEGDGDAQLDVVGQGTLEECADSVASLASDRKVTVAIQMDDLDLRFGPEEISELLRFLREERPGLSNTEIAEIKDPDA